MKFYMNFGRLFFLSAEPATYGDAELQGIIPHWPKTWVVQFTITILRDSPDTWQGITQFCHPLLDKLYGCRQPNVAYNKNIKKFHITLFHDKTKTNHNDRIDKYVGGITLNTRYDIKIETILVSGTYYFQVHINGQLAFIPEIGSGH